jgi:hypothetical protein
MNKTIIRIVIVLSGISLLGIVALQFVWFRKMMEMRENQFDRDVKAALGETARRLERDQALFFVSDQLRVLALADTLLASTQHSVQRAIKDETDKRPKPPPHDTVRSRSLTIRQRIMQGSGNQTPFVFFSETRWDSIIDLGTSDLPMAYFFGNESEQLKAQNLPPETENRKKRASGRSSPKENNPDKPANPRADYYNRIVDRQQRLYQEQMREIARMEEEARKFFHHYDPFGGRIRQMGTPAPDNHPGYRAMDQKIKSLENQTHLLNDALNRLVDELQQLKTPAPNRLNIPGTHEILRNELSARNISLPFEYAITTGINDTLARSPAFSVNPKTQRYEANLFADRFFQSGDRISLYFPGRNTQLLKSLSWLILASVLFTFCIVATFVVSIMVILKQKKISEIKTDFINNMTHEFKTPIATISLAADTLVNPRIIGDQERIHYYTRVIKEENKRMNTQVESVLQMALLDKKDFGLNLQPLDVHDLINQAIQNISIQIEKRGGQITPRTEAPDAIARVDEIHFLNVMFNLLDNANKYSPDCPLIEVSTANHQQNLVIEVKDHGMGMDRETRSRVFEKFYRKSTGNIHNVKGFGLGLSYVKAIVTACGGTIRVESEPGKGSAFIIVLPQNNHSHE